MKAHFRKIVSLLTVLILVVSLSPDVFAAKTKFRVDEVTAEIVTFPQAGYYPAYSVAYPENPKYTASIYWWTVGEIYQSSETMDPADTFQAGKTYWALIEFKPEEHYSFPSNQYPKVHLNVPVYSRFSSDNIFNVITKFVIPPEIHFTQQPESQSDKIGTTFVTAFTLDQTPDECYIQKEENGSFRNITDLIQLGFQVQANQQVRSSMMSEDAASGTYRIMAKLGGIEYTSDPYTLTWEEEKPPEYTIAVKDGEATLYGQTVSQAAEDEFIILQGKNPDPANQKFDHWEVDVGSASIKNDKSEMGASFLMPGENVAIRGIYTDKKPPVKEIHGASVSVAKPVRNGKPGRASSPQSEFTIESTVWNPNHSPFQPDTSYTVTVTVKASGGVFAKNASFVINGESCPATNNGQTATFSYTFPQTEKAPAPEPKPESKPESKPENKPESKPGSQPKTESQPESKPESKPEPETSEESSAGSSPKTDLPKPEASEKESSEETESPEESSEKPESSKEESDDGFTADAAEKDGISNKTLMIALVCSSVIVLAAAIIIAAVILKTKK